MTKQGSLIVTRNGFSIYSRPVDVSPNRGQNSVAEAQYFVYEGDTLIAMGYNLEELSDKLEEDGYEELSVLVRSLLHTL